MAEATYAKNTSLQEKNTNLQRNFTSMKIAITPQLHQQQLQTTAQAFAMNTQTMEHGGHNNTWQIWGGMEMIMEVTSLPLLFSHTTGMLPSWTTANIFALCSAQH